MQNFITDLFSFRFGFMGMLLMSSACRSQLEHPEPQLESFRAELHSKVNPVDFTSFSEGGLSLLGQTYVDGVERDFMMEFDTTDDHVALSIHSPGKLDLTSLNGQSLTAEIYEDHSWAGQTGDHLILSDEEGVVYFAQSGWFERTEDYFGEDFVRFGQPTSKTYDDDFITTYSSVIFDTDEGDVDLRVGEVASILIDGDHYQAVVISAYQMAGRFLVEGSDCASSSQLSFELLRVPAPIASDMVERPRGMEGASLACD
jgi:hypothetical protein